MLNSKTQCLSIYSWTISPWNSSFCRKIVSFTNFVTSNCVHNHFKQSRLKIREEQYPGTFHKFYMSESVVQYYNAHVLSLNLIKKTISSTHHCCDLMACLNAFSGLSLDRLWENSFVCIQWHLDHKDVV